VVCNLKVQTKCRGKNATGTKFKKINFGGTMRPAPWDRRRGCPAPIKTHPSHPLLPAEFGHSIGQTVKRYERTYVDPPASEG